MKFYLLGKWVLFFVLVNFFTSSFSQQISVRNSASGMEISWDKKLRLTGGNAYATNIAEVPSIVSSVVNDILVLHVEGKLNFTAESIGGILFDAIPAYKNGVSLWRYKPWNSWSKPLHIYDPLQLPSNDVQFYYWQYIDGTYGAMVPISGHGCRTTLGALNNQWGSQSVTFSNTEIDSIPALAVGFGDDPFELFKRIYQVAVQAMGPEINLQSKKKLPDPFEYIGWCTWNSSSQGKGLNENFIIKSVHSFYDHKFPLGWVLIDDGWLQQQDGKLQSFYANPKKFPNGFRHINNLLKTKYKIKYTGIWHALNGYWNGIDTASALGMHYKKELFTWSQKENVADENSPLKKYAFMRPQSDSLKSFYDNWYKYLRQQGFDFTKVDNQLVTERMSLHNYPLFYLSGAMHKQLYAAANKYFEGAIINCMDMTADAYFNFENSAVARSVEDYFPFKKDETYNMEKGNAPAHVVQAIYNALYFSQMVFPDFDMFQSHHPDAVFHALARTLSNGPIYLTDIPGQQNFELLNKLVYKDGKTIRSSTSLLPSRKCLFQIQDKQLMKAFSMAGHRGLLALYNAADTDEVAGYYSPADVEGINGKQFFLYKYFSGKGSVISKEDSLPMKLGRKGYELVYVVPVKNNFAVFGLVNKFNAPATILEEQWIKNTVEVKLYEGGKFKAYALHKPTSVMVNGKEVSYKYQDSYIIIDVPYLAMPKIKITWN